MMKKKNLLKQRLEKKLEQRLKQKMDQKTWLQIEDWIELKGIELNWRIEVKIDLELELELEEYLMYHESRGGL